jgi:hypothetical protein
LDVTDSSSKFPAAALHRLLALRAIALLKKTT